MLVQYEYLCHLEIKIKIIQVCLHLGNALRNNYVAKIELLFPFCQSVMLVISWTEILVPFAPETRLRHQLETTQVVTQHVMV